MAIERLDCLTVIGQLWDYLDAELPPEKSEAIHHHLATCDGCKSHIQFCREFLEVLRSVPVAAPDVDVMRARVLEAMRA